MKLIINGHYMYVNYKRISDMMKEREFRSETLYQMDIQLLISHSSLPNTS